MHDGLRLKTLPAVETTTAVDSYTSNTYDNNRHTGLIVDILLSNVTETTDGGDAIDITYTIQGKDPGSSAWVNLLATASIDDTNGGQLVHLVVDPRSAADTNKVARTPVPRQWRVVGAYTDVATLKAVMSYTLVP